MKARSKCERIVWPATLIVIVWAAVACSSGPSSPCAKQTQALPPVAGYSTFSDNVECFSMQFPSDWTKQPHANGTIVTFSAPAAKTGAFRSSLNVTSETVPSNATLDSYVNVAHDQIVASLPGVTFLDSKATQIAGHPAHEFTYTATSNGVTLRLGLTATVVNSRAYVITYSASAKNFAKSAEQAAQMINSFRFTS